MTAVADAWKTIRRGEWPQFRWPNGSRVRIPIATKLMLSFLLIIVIISGVFIAVGLQLIGNRVVAEGQEKVRNDLNAAREIYLNELHQISGVVRLTANSFFLREILLSGNLEQATEELARIREEEGLDILAITDKYGYVLLRAHNVDLKGDNQGRDELVRMALFKREPVASTMIVTGEDLALESPALAEQARFEFIDTPRARFREELEKSDGMMLKAAAPILDSERNLVGAVYGGVLLNRNYKIVDKVKQTVYEDLKYQGQDIGTATIFQDDVRISTNVSNEDGARAIRTRVSEEVYDQVIGRGEPWIGRAFVVNNWYITAYEPIRNITGQIIGILYVGVLEQKYTDIKNRTVQAFLVITIVGTVVAIALGYVISRKISLSIRELVTASREVAQGNLDAKVEIASSDELQELAETFNSMASAVKARDEQLKEYAQRRVRKSERLAMIGQLAAGVAHELNNPLQGIVAYSMLLLEEMDDEDPDRESVESIANQANRCAGIVRGLLDFSRQKTPYKKSVDARFVLEECVALVERQAIFHNIEIVKEFDQDLPWVFIDPSQIQQVFMNLIMNAAEAMDGSGRLTLSCTLDPAGEFVEVQFADTGCGISEENIEKVFVPFFTTKESGHGVGLGLAISYGIIRDHKGKIAVESQAGKGATFSVKLPVTGDQDNDNGQ